MAYKKSILTIAARRTIFDRIVERSLLWKDMTLDELKTEYLKLGHTPALSSENRENCLRWLYLSEMRRLVGD